MGKSRSLTLLTKVTHQCRDFTLPKTAEKHGQLIEFCGGHFKNSSGSYIYMRV